MLELIFNVKKRFFKRELKQTTAQIWNLEFGRYTSMFKREKNRQLYDQLNNALQMESAKEPKNDEVIKSLQAQLNAVKTDMDELDLMIDGSAPCEDYPNGYQGILYSLEAQIEKREHIKNFIKNYC